MKKEKASNIFILLYQMLKRTPIVTCLALVIPILGGLLNLYVYGAQAKIIDIVARNLGEQSWRTLLLKVYYAVIIYAGIFCIQAIANGIGNIFTEKLKANVTLKFREAIVEISNEIPFINYDDSEFYNKISRAKNVLGDDLGAMIGQITSCIQIIASILSVIILAYNSGYMSVVILVSLMIVVNSILRFSVEIKVRRLGREMTFAGRSADYLSGLFENSVSIREMRIYNCTDYFFNSWKKSILVQHKKRYSARRFEIKSGTVVSLIQTVVIFLVLRILISNIYNSPKITVGSITIIFISLLSMGWRIMSLVWPMSKLYVSSAKLYDLNEILMMKNVKKEQEYGQMRSDSLLPIQLSNVSFRYPNSTEDILKNINLKITKGEKVAFVGENGAGKTTLIKLILQHYKPTAGELSWNEKDGVNDKISVVFQSFMKLELSLRENIALGQPDCLYMDDKIMKVLKDCDLIDLYEELGSLDAPVGRILEGSRQLSGGQWQKLAIARAMFRDSELIIFDEPTASIDPVAEAQIFEKLMALCRGITAIFISHRMGWARNADRIILIDQGKIAEEGTHEELIMKNGLYANMYKVQANWYV
jgi:ATP-binding cassette subfamily B protein